MAVPPLVALHGAGIVVELVVTGEDRRRGRRAEPTPTPVKSAAIELGIPVAHDLAALDGCAAQLGVVVAFGRLIPADRLARLPMVNLHFSLLPRWRGAAPVERAVLAGDPTVGVCLMAVEEGLDTGAVYATAETPVGEATADELRHRLADLGAGLLVDALGRGLGTPEPQSGPATHAAKIGPEDLRLDWTRSAAELHRVVRVGGAWTTLRGDRLKIWSASVVPSADGPPGFLANGVVATGDGGLVLVEVQAAGRARQQYTAWAAGARLADGDHLD